jgi:toxin YoeB
MRNISFTDKGWSDLLQWSKTDRKIFTKIINLIEEASRNPFKGTESQNCLKTIFKVIGQEE